MIRHVHQDFELVERNDSRADPKMVAMREALRSTWQPPTDTFVTADIPLLLTKLSQTATRR